MQALSHNGFSTDLQAVDAMSYLEHNVPSAYRAVIHDFPEYLTHTLSGSWFDTDTMGVDCEWGSWLADRIEDTCEVWWEEGEPWGA